jgi:hypothetical protein
MNLSVRVVLCELNRIIEGQGCFVCVLEVFHVGYQSKRIETFCPRSVSLYRDHDERFGTPSSNMEVARRSDVTRMFCVLFLTYSGRQFWDNIDASSYRR